MTVEPLSDLVSRQYERWVYPEPILDLPSWLEDNWQWFDPCHAHRLLWPDRAYKPDMDILIAGCGTNQAAVFAYTNPRANVLAIDVSQTSLDHHRFLKNKYALTNLDLCLLPIEDALVLNRDFDLIVSTGVLHHLEEPQKGMEALGRCLKPDGVAGIMLYATYGRVGVEMLQSVFRDLGFQQNEPSVEMIKEALSTIPSDHPVQGYMELAPDLGFDAGLVDTFLHGRDRSYTIDECIELVTSADLAFQDLFLRAPYYPPAKSTSTFHAFVETLPEQKLWSIMERINCINSCHFFMACRTDRPRESYAIDFKTAKANNYIPSLRQGCRLEGDQLHRWDFGMMLDPFEQALVQQVDGRQTIRQIVTKAHQSCPAPQQEEDAAEALFQTLWRLDILAMGFGQ